MGVTVEIHDTASAHKAIRAALDHLVDTDVDTVANGELDDSLKELIEQRHRLDYTIATLAARWETAMLWAVDGSRSAAAHLARHTHTCRATAAATIRLGRQLRDLPHTADAMKHGTVSADHARLFAGCNSAERADLFANGGEHTLVDTAATLTFDQTAKAAAYWRHHADQALGLEGPQPDSRRGLRVGAGVGDEVHLEGDLDPVGGAEFVTALERIAAELATTDQTATPGMTRSPNQLRADALVEMARRATAIRAGARKPRPLVTIVCGQVEFQRLCELSNGHIIGPGDLAIHLDTLDIETMIFDGNFTSICSSPQRTFIGAVRRAIQVRDRHCQHPSGCDEPIDRCDIDHLIPHHHGGTTHQHNGRLLCLYHNRIQPHYTTPPPPPQTDPNTAHPDNPTPATRPPPDHHPGT
jgi:hypothetical protein